VIIVASVSLLTLSYCIINGTKTLNVFDPEGEGIIQSYTGPSVELKSVLIGEDSNRLGKNESNETVSENNPQYTIQGYKIQELVRFLISLFFIIYCNLIFLFIRS
jgi:hypothetical protein